MKYFREKFPLKPKNNRNDAKMMETQTVGNFFIFSFGDLNCIVKIDIEVYQIFQKAFLWLS